jgi:hypothetical protein
MMRRSNATSWVVKGAVVLSLVAAAPDAVRGEPNCTCRYAGQSYALETCVCIVTPGVARVACCDRVLNNTSWTFTGAHCPVAEAPARLPTKSVAGPSRPLAREEQRQTAILVE